MVSLLSGIWGAFVLRAALGALMVFRFQALRVLGAALVLLAMLICLSITTSRRSHDASAIP
jgi:hypothetical protein